MKKKATISVDMTFIGISLAIAFVVIVIFLFRMAPTDVSDTATCESSIQLKNAFNIKDAVNVLPVEINCKIQYVCFTSGMLQNCNDNFGAGEKVKEINVGNDKEKLKEELAKLQYSCWKMLGQGKLDYYPRGFDWEKSYCSPCYIFAFSKELQQENSKMELDYINYLNYLAKNPTPGEESVSYLYYLFRIADPYLVNAIEEGLKGKNSITSISTNKKYAIMAITSKGGWLGTIGGGTVALVGGILVVASGGSLGIPVIILSGSTLAGGAFGNWITPGTEIIPSTIFEYNSDIFEKYKCQMDFIK